MSNDTTIKLERGLSLPQATAINMIEMVGIGPFVTIPIIVSAMHGAASIFAWLVGALLAYMDGMVWAELGAKWPEAGGSYAFLGKLFGNGQKRSLTPFLFIWQTVIQAPLVIASGAIGFSQYFGYLVPLTDAQRKIMSGGLVVLLVLMVYRNIKSIGRISIVLSVITVGTILWLILSGFGHYHQAQAFDFHFDAFDTKPLFFAALSHASLKAIYSYLGYYNICHLGAEIKDPGKNIPRSIMLSITGVAIMYLGMQTVIVGVLPWQAVAGSEFVVSTFFEHVYGHLVAQVATVLILFIALASLFSAILGYSRIPYAAALNGDFFPVFARVHPRLKFPHISVLVLGGFAFIFALLFKMKEVITAIVVMRILTQFVSQAVGVIAWHYRRRGDERPYRMPLFPLPALISIAIWLVIFCTSDWRYVIGALGFMLAGVILFFIRDAVVAEIT